MQLQVVGEVNKISKTLEKRIPKLEQGEIKTFQMLTGVTNNDPDRIEKEKYPVLYANHQIPTKDRIKDPETGNLVEIAVIQSVENQNGRDVIVPRFFMPGKGEPQFRYSGKFQLVGGNIEDEELYAYLCLCSFNRDNPNRDKKKDALFYEINLVKESEEKTNKIQDLRTALNLAIDISVDGAKEIAQALNWPDYQNEVLASKIGEYAQSHPSEFIRIYNDPKRKEKALVKEAFDKDVLKFNITTREVSMNGSILTTLVDDTTPIAEATYKWLATAPNGNKTITAIQKQLKAAKEAEPA